MEQIRSGRRRADGRREKLRRIQVRRDFINLLTHNGGNRASARIAVEPSDPYSRHLPAARGARRRCGSTRTTTETARGRSSRPLNWAVDLRFCSRAVSKKRRTEELKTKG